MNFVSASRINGCCFHILAQGGKGDKIPDRQIGGSQNILTRYFRIFITLLHSPELIHFIISKMIKVFLKYLIYQKWIKVFLKYLIYF